ncbi:tripartite motif-containing protein 66 isoform X2 [Pangasianodon hypophthalmus]|uniref:tripartite motif-containing protein 66 isoform X2 n=1 Tax=Pangasianodon hypophthalmus TaxID=310915 RepID=UPI0023075D7B|nr:tripartite motif-containing protein 66 isoform X2 [Pangasianodon hypophthalmus]
MEKCCSECPEPRMAQSLCTFCNKWLCFQCTDLHQHERVLAAPPPESRHHPSVSSPTAPSEPGSACCGRAVVMCPLHKQELLELFCETCDLLACSICHLSAHKDHRLVHVGKALQDQRWLLENLMARVEEKRSAVENTAKQIQGRLHSVKITQRKAENQIKMAKMIMMNELNKRANLLIEQLESISSGFKQHLEDQLQGAIELCSQLEHVQNFITWAVAHHRRNPLLFSKELIALQMQQLLEPLIHSETWAPLKIKFNWDASFWTKQISTLGQLSVEGGSRSYSEGVGRPGILRPQPVPCVSVPSLCYPLREADCSYQSFCQHQLCCLHCRPAPSVPLEKYPLPLDKYSVPHAQEPSCSSPPSLQRRWNSDATAQVHPSQNSTLPQSLQRSPDPDPVKHAAASDFQPQSSRGRPTDQEIFPEKQLEGPAGVECSEDRLSAQADEDVRTPGPSDMLVQDGGCGANAESPESRTAVCSISAEPGSSGSASYESRSLGVNQSAGTAAGEQDHTAQRPEYTSPTERISDDVMIRFHPDSRDGSSQTVYKTEPDNAYAYSYGNTSCMSPNKYSIPRQVQDTRKAPEGSKVPVVCLERLKILVSRCPPQGHHSTAPPADSRLKCEGVASQELDRELSAEEESVEEPGQRLEVCQVPSEPLLAEHLPCSAPPVDSESSLQELRNQSKEFSAPSTAPAQSSDPELSKPPESEPASDPNPAEPRSVPASDSQLESTAEADSGSDAELESELQVESVPSSTSEPQIESDAESDLESEQVLELSGESTQELESDPDSTAEVTLNLEQECEWEAEQVGADASVQEEVGVVERECVEMENEDFCAVCSIGGELLCCDRCPKVFHLTCHVPSLLSFPTGDWVCTLCRDVQRPEVEYDCEESRLPPHTPPSALSPCDLRKCEKLTLLIYSNILSAPFHEPVSPLARHYYQIIKRPMDLSVIRSRLKRSSSAHYSSAGEFVSDVLLMFKNCAKFNYPDSEVAQAGHSLQNFFLSKLSEVFPELSCPAPDDDSDSDDYEEPECAAAVAFPWPERREHSHRKRKRRRSLSWRRHHY